MANQQIFRGDGFARARRPPGRPVTRKPQTTKVQIDMPRDLADRLAHEAKSAKCKRGDYILRIINAFYMGLKRR